MYQSIEKTKKMLAFHCEIYPDKLVRVNVNETCENEEENEESK
jgi:hypothetical protein